MAEFQEVVKQWGRMCAEHICDNREEDAGKLICPLVVKHSGYPCDDAVTDLSLAAVAQVEEIVMQWAAEHPEPVYPTWADYITHLMINDIVDRNDTKPQTLGEWMGNTPIPADIAKKLGIEPKEGA